MEFIFIVLSEMETEAKSAAPAACGSGTNGRSNAPAKRTKSMKINKQKHLERIYVKVTAERKFCVISRGTEISLN